MEWIKKILDKHKKEDGTVDMDAAMKEINDEFPKNAVPKDKYNDISSQLKNANKTIEDLKKNNTDNETLQKTIQEHEATIQSLKTEAEKKKKK
ncbi:phage scaffolding protein [Tepidibacillus marianensis]|uniref:phage scaffolding protein n=1 Tax=Tepidibacillus marianensis TaxID=3131995 RepID=UPI0030CFDF28